MVATTAISRAAPSVSVIIPARNEEACLGPCLQSLISQTGIDFEIIVVDDHSSDRTLEIARSFAGHTPNCGFRIIDAPVLALNSTGKNNALVAGVKAARGHWCLFTDADTIHLPGSMVRAVDEATRHKAEMLSYSPEQTVVSFAEKAVMPVIFAELAVSYLPSEVTNPKSSAAAANGQYILITREAYDAVGGHAAIADQILEDVALARNVKRSGRKIFFRYGGDAVRARMYRNFSQLREGWTKNLALLFSSAGTLAMLRLAEFALITAGFAVTILELVRGNWLGAILSAALAAITSCLFLIRIRRAHFSASANALAVFGLPLFAYLLLRSRNLHRQGVVEWKGRTYSDLARKNVFSAPNSGAVEDKQLLATES